MIHPALLHPFIHYSSGEISPLFPRSLLRFHLLSQDDLNDLARFYEPENAAYPCPTPSWEGAPIPEQRRLFACFIGIGAHVSSATRLPNEIVALLQGAEKHFYRGTHQH
jgi:hypothetical protein